MDTNNQEFYEDEEVQEIPVRKKKKKKGLIIFLVILILQSRAAPDITSTSVRNQLKLQKIISEKHARNEF